MRSPASLLCVLSLLAAVACGDETPDSAANSTSGAAPATTADSTLSGSGGSTAGSAPTTGGGEPTGGSTGATSAEDVGAASSTTAGTDTTGGTTNDSGQSTGGGTAVTGESGGAGESDGGATGDASDTTAGDAGVVELDAGDDAVLPDSKLCSETHPEGGCDTEMIAACVCEGPSAGVEGEPSCCEPAVSGDDAKNGWDEVCQIIAYSEGCAGNCCEVHAEGSCELPKVEKCVCDALPECCMPADDSEVTQNGWDGLCLAAAAACGAPCI